MNKFKKCLSIMLTMIILTASVLVCQTVSAEEVSASDIAVSFAKGMGLIEEYTPDAEITVGELASVVDKLSNGSGISANYFEEYRYEGKASLQEAIEVFLDMTGHRELAGLKYGGITTKTTLLAAKDAKLLDGITMTGKTTLVQGDMVQLAYNLLYVKVVESKYLANGIKDMEISNQLYMEGVLGYYELNGVVEKTSYSSIDSVLGTEDDSIIINGKRYVAPCGKYEEFIGCDVTALINEKAPQKELVAIHDTSKTLIINAEDIHDNTNKKVIEYYNSSNKRVRASLDASVDVLYNFTLYDAYSADDFKIDFGRLVLIDNNGDRKYDVVKIEEHDSMYIFSASIDSKQIMDEFGNSVSIEYLVDNDIYVDVNGALVPTSALPTEQMATFYRNKDGEVIKLYVTKTVEVAGKISNVKPEINRVHLGDKDYTYNNRVKQTIESMEKGHTVTVFLDKYGIIASINISRDKYSWGYMMDFTDGSGLGGPKIKVFTEDGVFEIFELARKVNFNGSSVSAEDVIAYSLDTGFWDEIGKKTTLIKYKANSKKEITALLTPTLTDPGTSGRPYNQEDGLFMYLSSGNITPKVRLSKETIVFLIPQDMSFEHRFKAGTKALLSNSTEYTTKLYNIDENYYAEVMVARIENYPWNQVDEWSWNAKIVEKVGTIINDRGEESRVIYTSTISDGTKDRLIFNNPDLNSTFDAGVTKTVFTPKDIQVGDIVQFAVDAADTAEITDFVMRYSQYGTKPYEKVVGNSWRTTASIKRFYSEGGTYATGKVVEIIKDGLVINNRPDGDPAWNRTCSYNNATPVWIFDKTREELKRASVSDIVVGDEVYNGHSGGKLQGIVIYRD